VQIYSQWTGKGLWPYSRFTFICCQQQPAELTAKFIIISTCFFAIKQMPQYSCPFGLYSLLACCSLLITFGVNIMPLNWPATIFKEHISVSVIAAFLLRRVPVLYGPPYHAYCQKNNNYMRSYIMFLLSYLN
jgi:hypothetical protein